MDAALCGDHFFKRKRPPRIYPWTASTQLGVNYALNSFQIVLLVAYAATFGTPRRLRRTVALALFVSAVVQFVLFVAGDIALLTGTRLIVVALVTSELLFSANLVACAIPLVCTIQSAGRERSVLIWTAVPLATACVTLAFVVALRVLMPDAPDSLWRAALIAVDVGFFAMPAGLTYAILSRRVLSAGFVLNRAAVFSGVSLVIVGVFMLLESIMGHWLEGASHATSLAVNGAVAVALGMSIRFIHGRVDHVLDTVFFRKRHEDEHALRAFAHEASFFTDPEILKQRTAGVLEKHADASFVNFAANEGNDPAIVTLRATHKPVDLTAIDATSISGEWAYPMVARGRMHGAMVLGPKRSSESYAPDESDAVMHLAHSVAGALEIASAHHDGALERISELLETLPDRLAERLKSN